MAQPIVTLAKAPEAGLVLSVIAEGSMNKIRRNLGNYRALYLKDGASIVNKIIYLMPEQTVNCDTEQWLGGMLHTNVPIIFQGSKDGKVTTINVKSLLVVDDTYDYFSITATEVKGGDTAKVQLNYCAVPPQDNSILFEDDVPIQTTP